MINTQNSKIGLIGILFFSTCLSGCQTIMPFDNKIGEYIDSKLLWTEYGTPLDLKRYNNYTYEDFKDKIIEESNELGNKNT